MPMSIELEIFFMEICKRAIVCDSLNNIIYYNVKYIFGFLFACLIMCKTQYYNICTKIKCKNLKATCKWYSAYDTSPFVSLVKMTIFNVWPLL